MNSFLLAAPLIVFVAVALLGFAGCELDTSGKGPDGPPPSDGQPPPDGEGPPDGQPPAPKTYQQEVLDDLPLAYWRLGDSDKSQPAKDEVGPAPGNHPGVFNSTDSDLVLQQAGLNLSDPTAQSTLFDGGNVTSDVAAHPELATQSFTIEALVVAEWVSGAGQVPTIHVVASSHDPGANTGWALYATAQDEWQGRVWGPNQDYLTPTLPVAFGDIVHLAMTYDVNTGELMLFASDQDSLTTSVEHLPNTTLPICIGAGMSAMPPAFPFKGRIQEVALWGSALPKDRIGAHYTANKPPP